MPNPKVKISYLGDKTEKPKIGKFQVAVFYECNNTDKLQERINTFFWKTPVIK